MADNSTWNIKPSKWPSDFAGESLFTSGADLHNTAVLNWMNAPMHTYAAGYKDAADALAAALVARRAPLDSAIYPLIFLYRQGLELEHKLILPLARRVASKPVSADHKHFLMPMWRELRALVMHIDPQCDVTEMNAVEGYLQEIDDVDPASMSFRYPVDKKGEIHLPNLTHINVPNLSEIMDSIFMFFGGLYSWLADFDQDNY